MAGEGTATAALPPEVQEKLSRLEKLEKDYEHAQRGNASLAAKVRAWERIDKELGDVLERDANGLPVRVLVDESPSGGASPAVLGTHPLSGLGMERPEIVDQYYERLFQQKGYLTKQEAEKLAEAKAQAYANIVLGNAKVWRMADKLVSREDYKDLANKDSELSKRTARLLQERQYGVPMAETWGGFDEWRYRDLGDLQFAADLARLELAKEAAANAEADAKAKSAQAAGGLSPAPDGSGVSPAPTGKPDFGSMQHPEEIIAALDKSLQGAGAPSG